MDFLDKLNPEQREAVLHTEGPAADSRGRGVGQDARHHLPHRLPHRQRPRRSRTRCWRSPSPTRPPRRCASASQSLLGDDCRRRVAVDVPLALRAAAAARGAAHRAVARLRDLRLVRPGRGRQAGACSELGIDDKLVPPRAALARISQAKNRMEGPDVAARRVEPARRADRQDLREVPRRAEGAQRARLRRPAAQDRRALRDVRAGARALRAQVQVRHGRRVPGHQPAAVPADPAAGRAPPQPRASSAIRTSRSTSGAAPTCATSWTSSSDFGDAKVVRLEQNYRSTQVILDAATAVIQQNRNRKDKRLWTDRKGGDEDRLLPRQRRARGGRLHRASRSSRRRADDVDTMMAVLYRTNAQSRAIEDSLMRESIPYKIIGGVRFYERKEIKDALAYLQADHQSARRREPAAGDQRAGARHRQGRDGLAAGDRSRPDCRGRAAAARGRPRRGQLGAIALGAAGLRGRRGQARQPRGRVAARLPRSDRRRWPTTRGPTRCRSRSARCSTAPATSTTCATRTAKKPTSGSRT